MATDWAADVKKYAPNADDGIIAGIVRYCGIALRKVDSSLVAFSDKKETDRVRENFLKKKLGLTQADKTLDAAIAKVGAAMKADRTKNRVTVYYLLAENFKKLDMFAPKAKAAAKAPAKKKAAPAKKAAVVATTKKATTRKVAIKATAVTQGLMDKAASAGTAAAVTAAAAGTIATGATSTATSEAGAAGLAASAADTAGSAVSGAAASLTGTDDEDSGLDWLLWLLFAALVAFVLWWVFMRGSPDEAATPAAATTAAAAPAAAD